MVNLSGKLNNIAQNTDSYLKSFFSKQNSSSHLIKSMKYGIFSGGKRFRSAIIVNAGKICPPVPLAATNKLFSFLFIKMIKLNIVR